MKNKSLKIINMNGRKCRKEKSTFGDMIGGFTSILYALSIAGIGLELASRSLQSSKLLDAHLESGVRGYAREVVRV